MSVKLKALQAAAGSAGGEALNVEDVFSTYLYAGDGTNGREINNGIDLSGKGGMVWFKARTTTQNHRIFDTERGSNYSLITNGTTGQANHGTTGLNSFDDDGFTLGNAVVNGSGIYGGDYASWTFRKAPKFFDVVEFTYSGSAQISHNLGCKVGAIIMKRTDAAQDWLGWFYRGPSAGSGYYLSLNTNNSNAGARVDTEHSDTYFNPLYVRGSNSGGTVSPVSGGTYIAYLFAHNDGDGEFGPTGDQDIIKCGSFTSSTGAGTAVDLGFEPQWVLTKWSGGTENWKIHDNMRGISSGSTDAMLKSDTSQAEDTGADHLSLNPNGFNGIGSAGRNYIYIAIRRGPMAVPESASEVFDIKLDKAAGLPGWISSTGVVDFAMRKYDYTLTGSKYLESRLQGSKAMSPESAAAESNSPKGWDYSTGYTYSTGTTAAADYAAWMWKRAPNFFDVVTYTGDGVQGRDISHNLKVAPEMMWIKRRDANGDWVVYHSGVGNTASLRLDDTRNTTGAVTSSWWDNTSPTDSVFTVGSGSDVNTSTGLFVAYLFASLDGISKVGSYTGDGTSGRIIDCGFSNGARFVLAKSYTHADNWWLFDSERGIVAGNDPRLWINDSAAEVTNADLIDTHSSGFIVNNANGDLNDTGRSYIFYAIA